MDFYQKTVIVSQKQKIAESKNSSYNKTLVIGTLISSTRALNESMPFAIHANYFKNSATKKAAMKEYGLWLYNEDANICREYVPFSVAVS